MHKAHQLDDLLQILEAGATLDEACGAVGVSRQAIRRRRQRDEAFGARVQAILKARKKPSKLGLGDGPFDAMLAVLAAGKHTIEQAAAMPGMPSRATFEKRRQDDPAFAARVAAVWKPLRARALEGYDWDGALQRIRNGERPKTFLGTGRFPWHGSWSKRRRTDPEFDARVRDALKCGKIDRPWRCHSDTVFTEVVERLSEGKSLAEVCSLPGMPTRTGVLKRRSADPALNAAILQVWSPDFKRRKYSTLHFDQAVQAVAGGHPVSRLRELGLPGSDQLYKLRRRDADFAATLQSARATIVASRRALRAQRRRERDAARARNRLPAGELFRLQLSQNELWARANAAVSRALPSFVRDDAIAEMIADAVEGYLDPADFRAAAREYVADAWGEGSFGMRSLDADLHGDGGRTLHDVLGVDHSF